MQIAWGYAPPIIIEAALKLDIFEKLNQGPLTLGEMALSTGASVRGLRAILNALVGFDLLAKLGGSYALTPESAAFLVPSKPGFHGGLFRHVTNQLIPKWLSLTEIVRTGKPSRAVNDEQEGAGFFERFVEDIFPMSYPAASALARELRLAEATDPVRVLDVAAGSGVWGIALAQASPKVHVTALDWEQALKVTRKMVTRFGLAGQFGEIGGDLKTVTFGDGYDVVTLGHILHSEGAAASRKLLGKVAGALKPGGTVAIGEFTPNDDRTGPPHALIFAVNMLVNTDEGDAFTLPEVRSWLEEAGFEDVRTIPTPGPSPLILAARS